MVIRFFTSSFIWNDDSRYPSPIKSGKMDERKKELK